MPIGIRKVYRKGRIVKAPTKQIVVAIKAVTGEIIFKSFAVQSEAADYADMAKRLGCEVLKGWSV